MTSPATELSRQLARNAETVCRHYLSNGRKQGHYWLVGDVHNTPGRSMFVLLSGPLSGNRAAGKWTDAATGQHGDLLDVIRESCGLVDFKDVADEARRFLSLPLPDPTRQHSPRSQPPAATGSQEAARRLFAMGVPIRGTPAEAYLRGRGIGAFDQMPSLRFHPACFYGPESGGPVARLPAMLAAITDLEGRQTGTHRTWLRPDGSAKADIDTPRRAMGALLGNGVRFGARGDVLIAGEGIETVLSVRSALPELPAVAALSSGHLAALRFPAGLRRLYVLRDRDRAGAAARDRLEAQLLLPEGPKVAVTGGADFNDHRLIWAHLDQVHAKQPDMVLLHGGSPKGAEIIASRWADHRKVPQVAFRPDWTKHGRSAPFKRNDAMLDVMPIGVLVFPGTGIQENLADKARKLGIPVLKHEGGA